MAGRRFLALLAGLRPKSFRDRAWYVVLAFERWALNDAASLCNPD